MRSIDQLTDQQRQFVVHYTSDPEAIGNGAEAARRAGYSTNSAREIARQLLDKPHIRAAIEKANRDAISGRLSTKAVALLERVMDDESAPAKVRVDAAKTVLDRAGILPPSVAEQLRRARVDGKEVHEMTLEEIQGYIARLEGEMTEVETKAGRLLGPVIEGEATDTDGGDND